MPETFSMDSGAAYEQPLPQSLSPTKALDTAAAAVGVRLAVQAMSAQLWAGNTETNLSLELQFHTETDPITDVRTPIVNLLKLTMPSTGKYGFLESPGPSIDFGDSAASIAKDAGTNIGTSIGSVVNGVLGSDNVTNFLRAVGITPKAGSLTNTSQNSNDGANNTVPADATVNPSMGTAAYWNTKLKNRISIKIGNYLFFDSVVITRVSITAASNFDAQTGLPHHCRVLVEFKPLFMLTQQDLDTLFINPSASTPLSCDATYSLPGVASAAKNLFSSF
ncbi:hypothetical protein [Enterococcus faecium]|uniref:hypothetical protein n=1 Tax=Enterococcus faecium TaxID=1352 RepID=UPI0025B22A26|nr:hypothetical protein [Enterococcus faecium]